MQSDIALRAINQFRKDWPFMASLLDDMRTKEQRKTAGCAAAPVFPAPVSKKAEK